ncbi:hypothetical protein CDL15_Pgr020797 [Punica granatum]|uniref:Uncharacterized protein n=1 Tax=Punica granatum TaxID=22663 RepID=A0A218XV58_PUNGR|nr:hypothetical protein CDL15_Pgr020797 [Punica granatum]
MIIDGKFEYCTWIIDRDRKLSLFQEHIVPGIEEEETGVVNVEASPCKSQ